MFPEKRGAAAPVSRGLTSKGLFSAMARPSSLNSVWPSHPLGWAGLPEVMSSNQGHSHRLPENSALASSSLCTLLVSRGEGISQLEGCFGPSFLFHLQEEKMAATWRNRIGCSLLPYLQLLHLTTRGPVWDLQA